MNDEVIGHTMDTDCSSHYAKRNACRILVRKPEERRPLGRSRRRWEYNIELDLTDIEWNAMNSIDPTQDMDQCRTLVVTIVNLRNSIK
jgi:hypothetical protein